MLRQRVTTRHRHRAASSTMTIGPVRDADLGQEGWLNELKTRTPATMTTTCCRPCATARRWRASLCGALLRRESSMLMVRKDLADKAGVKFAERPTWNDRARRGREDARPPAGVYGISCAASLAGATTWPSSRPWSTASGGQWFDMGWKPQLDQQALADAISFYVDLLKKYGPPGSSARTASTRSWRSSQRGQVRDVDRRDHRRPSSPTRSRAAR